MEEPRRAVTTIKSQPKHLLGIASGQGSHGWRIESLNRCDMAKRIVLRHIVGVIGSEQNVVRAELVHQSGELVRRKHDGIHVNAFEIGRRRLWQRVMAVGARTPSMIDAPGIGAEISAAVDREDLQARKTLEHAVKDQIMQRDRGLKRIADNVLK